MINTGMDRASYRLWKGRLPALGLRLRIVLLSVISITPIFFLEIHNAGSSAQQSLAEAHERARALVGQADGKFDNTILQAETLVNFLAEAPDIVDLQQPACDNLVIRAGEQYPWLTAVYALSTAGTPVCSKPLKQPVNVSDSAYFKAAMRTKELTMSGYRIGQVSHKPVISILKPVLGRDGAVTRLVGAGISLAAFSATLDDHEISSGASITVIDRAGLVIGRFPDAERYLGKDVSETPLFQAIREHDRGEVESAGLAGDERIFAFQPFTGTDAHIIVGIPEQPVLAHVHRQLRQTLVALIVILAACALLAIIVSEALLLRPIRSLTRAAGAIGGGDYLLAEGVRHSSMPEIDRLLSSFKSMAAQLGAREADLKASESKAIDMNRNLLLGEQIANVGYWRLDVPSYNLSWSQGVYHVFHAPPEFEVTLATALDTIHPEDRKDCAEYIERAIALHRDYEHTIRVIRRDGGTSHVVSRGFCEIGPDGTVAAVFGTVIDVTELKETELRLQAARRLAESANVAKSDFLSSMSHELRTPLTSIIGFADIMLLQVRDDESRRYLTLQREAGKHLLTMINDILDHSKIEAGKLQLEAIPFDLHALIVSCCESLALEAERKDIALSRTVPVTVPRMIVGDPARLKQILFNLLSNAIKFTQGGAVTLSVELAGEAGDVAALRFAVSDTGIGIPADKLSRLFQRFSQVDASTTRQYGGTGLGLSISKSLIEAMGGSITVESTPGKGSVFSFGIRVMAVSQTRLPDTVPSLPPAVARKGRRILLADDSPANQFLFCEILKLLGHEVVTVDNGLLAVEAIRRERFDIVLMDMQMPVMDGLTATRTIREHHDRTVPIVGLTANAGAGDVERCYEAGMNGHLAKPVEIPALVSKIDELTADFAPAE